jgi:gliding motility-associated lipoprotein GldJ
MGRIQDDIMADWNNNPKQQYVQSFYMDEAEATNLMYNEYLYWLKLVFPPSNEIYAEIYRSALPDSTVWRSSAGYNETLISSYLRHPAYANYPVVGVTWLQANDYAKWRTDRVNELTLERAGYLKKDAKILEAYGDAHFSTETYLTNPEAVYGGNSDIVRRGVKGKAKEGEKKYLRYFRVRFVYC